MARWFVAWSILAAVLAASGSASPSATERVFRDTTGENPAGPDITTVNVWSDGYRLAFKFAIPTSPVVTPDMRIRIWLDADDSLETGLTFETGPTGLDHFVIVDPTRFRPDEAKLYTCRGTVCSGGEGWSSVEFSYANGAAFTIDARSLGLTRIARLRFSVSFYVGIGFGPDGYDFSNARLDFAPDLSDEESPAPMWTFDAEPIAITDFQAKPARPHAGSPFTLAMRVQRTDTGAALTRGEVTCSLRVGRKRVPARTSRFVGRLATCEFAVPAGTKGRRYRATIAVAAEGTSVTRSVSGRVS